MFGASGDLAIQRKVEKPVMTVEKVDEVSDSSSSDSKNEVVTPQ
jgi:hypothetical protein